MAACKYLQHFLDHCIPAARAWCHCGKTLETSVPTRVGYTQFPFFPMPRVRDTLTKATVDCGYDSGAPPTTGALPALRVAWRETLSGLQM